MAARAPADGRELALSPAPALRPLTWAGAERALSFLRVDDGTGPVPLALPVACGPSPPPFTLADPAGLVRAACADGDPGAEIVLRWPPDALAAGASVVARGLIDEVRAADAQAAAYGALRTFEMEGAYRAAYAEWRGAPGAEGRAPRSLPVALAAQGPAVWEALETWPLGRLLRWAEDAAVGAFLDELDRTIEEAREALAGGRHG